jgi:hypothetical protein
MDGCRQSGLDLYGCCPDVPALACLPGRSAQDAARHISGVSKARGIEKRPAIGRASRGAVDQAT